jgi:hypothetical protein
MRTDLIAIQLDAGDMMLAEAAPEEDHLSVQDPPARGGNWIHSGHSYDFVFYDEKERKLSFFPPICDKVSKPWYMVPML